MPDPKLIHKERLQVEDKEKAKLSYLDIFKADERKDIDYESLIERTNQEWMRKMNDARQQSVQEGYEAGLRDGEENAKEIIEFQLHHFETILKELDEKLNSILNSIRPGVTQLVFALLEKLIEVPFEQDNLKEWVTQKINENIDGLLKQQDITITVSEQDYDAVNALMKKMEPKHNIKITYSTHIHSGEYKLETPEEAVINNFKKKLNDLKQQIPLDTWEDS